MQSVCKLAVCVSTPLKGITLPGQTRLHWNQMFCSAERADNHAFIRNRLNVQALQENDE